MNNNKNKTANKIIIVIFISTILLANINNLFATSLTIECIRSYYTCHDHRLLMCDQEGNNKFVDDDYTGDYYARYLGKSSGHKCYLDGGNKNGYGESGTSDHCEYRCAEYGLYIGDKRIDTIEKFLEQVPATELLKVYDPNMVP